MSPELAERIPGAPEFIAWFGHFPSFHDGSVTEFSLDLSRNGLLVVQGHRMNPQVDEKGHFVLDKHCVVTFHLRELTEVDVSFENAAEIVSHLAIKVHEDGFEIEIDAINGFDAMLRMKALSITFEPRANP